MTGTLYIVATPIGNLEDITLRAIRVLRKVDIILAEDTRVTGKLLNFIGTKVDPQISLLLPEININEKNPKIISYHQHSNERKKLEILKTLQEDKNIALVTDAGSPGISDPGNELISFLYENDPLIKFVPVPGSSAISASLSVCGFDINRFVFLGFMPKKKKVKLYNWLKEGEISFAYYDSPYRVIKNLEEIEGVFGSSIKVFVARELTKIYETLYRGSVQEVIDKLKNTPIKGEIVVVVNKS